MKLFNAVNSACGELPENFHINIHIENGAGYIELFDLEGDEILFESEDLSLEEQVREAVFVAKAKYNNSIHADFGCR